MNQTNANETAKANNDTPAKVEEAALGENDAATGSILDQARAEIARLKAETKPEDGEASENSEDSDKKDEKAESSEGDSDNESPEEKNEEEKKSDAKDEKDGEKAAPAALEKRVKELEASIETEKARAEELAEQAKSLGEYRTAFEEFRELSAIDPALADVVKSHWYFQGRYPTLDDFDGNAEAYAKIVRHIERKNSAAPEKGADAGKAPSIDERITALEAEEKTLASNPVYGQFMNDKDVAAAYDFLAEQFANSANPAIDSLEKAFDHLFKDRVVGAVKKLGREEQARRADKSRKVVNLAPKGAAPASKEPDFSKMTMREQARWEAQRLRASV